MTFALLLQIVPNGLVGLTASAAVDSAFDRISDHESIDYWKGYFSDGQYDSDVWSDTISTKNAGAVWTDKSVFIPEQDGNITIDGVNVPVADTEDNFLVSMSVMASNKTVKGYEYIPTSTMLVLDVSGSMGNGNSGNRSWDEMVKAANKAIDTLLNLNSNNLVGVVLYSGNTDSGNSSIGHSTLILPLDRYTTTATNSNGTNNRNDDYPEYLTASNSTVGVNSAVRPRQSGSKGVAGGTYIQGGIYRAMEELIDKDAPKEVTEGVQAGMAYTPIVVLMSDGAPTAANLDYDFNENDSNHVTDIGDGTSTDERMGFLTQLTAAYAKARIDEAYEKSPLFYTLGLGINSLSSSQESIAEAVLDPKTSSGNINTYWNNYLRLDNDNTTAIGNTMYLNNYNSNAVVKNDYVTADYKNYVTQYFEAVASQNVTLEQALLDAFQQIVDSIIIQSIYYPTEIGSGSADLGGYVTFRDELGEYMDVHKIKGFLFEDENGNQVLHTGAKLARNFVAGGGDLGQSSNPKPLGDELVRAVKARLGIEDTVIAQNVIRNAYYYKQLYYADENNFSNYIGWYGDANGKFVDFWHDGHTKAEEQAAIAKGAKFVYRSYGYLGEVNEDLGIKASDMMYTSIRVRKTIADGVEGTAVGEIIVEGSIPASLIPTITYEVALNGKTYESGVKSVTITDTSAKYPARILYEVGLRSDINSINITEKVDSSYRNQDGTYTFYTNDWEFVDIENNAIADTSVNAFTHFEPSNENERYYYLTDSVVYSNAQGTEYTGPTKPSGDGYYHEYRVFSVTNGRVSSEITYIKTSPDALTHAVQSGNNWVIPAGTGKHEIVGYEVPMKDKNNTETNRFTAYPKIKTDAANSSGEHNTHYSVVTFGNNGRLTVTPATGIKITKSLEAASTTAQTFEFKISGAVANEKYIATPLDAEGNFGAATVVTANSSGVITVNVEAGASVYVTGLAAGKYTVTESDHSEYRVLTINGDVAASNSAEVEVVSQKTTEVSYVNTLKGFGSLYITKEVVNALANQTVPEHATSEEFDITVDVGTALAGKTYEAAHSANNSLKEVTVGNDGKITGLKIKHGETIVIRDLPENTNAVVTETLSADQSDNYTVAYSSHNKAGEDMDNNGSVTIIKDANATVVVSNTYKPVGTSVAIGFDGTKSMDATTLEENKTFEFVLEKYQGGAWAGVPNWKATAEITAHENQTGNNAVKINFNNFKLNLEFTEPGVHTYRIYEKEPATADGITYDPAIHTFVVTVIDNNGQLVATVTGNTVSGSGNAYTVNANFTNAYDTEPVIINVNKVVVDATKDVASPAGYEFELYASNAAGEYTANDLIDTDITDENGDTRFSWLVGGEDEGTHYYVLKEKVPAGYTKPAADAYGWHYDTREILIKVVVSVDNNVVSVKIGDGAQATNTAEYTFTNEYKAAPAVISLGSIATKTLNGRDLVAGEFTFQLTDANGQLLAEGRNIEAAEMGSAAPIKFFKPGSNEEFKLVYTEVGTHHYKISEVAGNRGGVDYTSRIFDMVVEVTDNGNGALQANYFFEDSTNKTVNFVNTYSVKHPTSIQLEATKKLTGGRPMLSNEFHFEVFEMTDDTFKTKKFENAVATGSNIGADPDANGVAVAPFKFTAINYTEPGIHYYQISETAQDNDLGTSYDKSLKNVVVTVVDNLDGTITASVVESDELVFTNVYTPRSVSVKLNAEKNLNGGTLKEGDFEFALFEATVTTVGSKEVWTAGAQVGENVKNAANGNIQLPEVVFETKGTYYYIAKEVIGTKSGVTYDETEFYITATVTDDHKGTLTVDTIITNNDGELSLIVFNNEYTTDKAQIVLEGTKTLLGRDMNEGEFSFVIKEGETVVAEGKNTAAKDGVGADIEFEAIEYTLADVGEHTYTIEEVVPEGDKNGVTYDEKSFTVKVTVEDNGDGTLSVAADKTKADIAFTNGYSAEGVTVDLSKNAKKTLDGRVMNTEEFTFELYEVISSEETELIQSVMNDAEGNFSFNPITYDEEGVYEYLVKELKGDKGGIIYDETVYFVIVKVTDNLFGKLVAKVTITNAEEDEVDELIFKNLYKVNETGIVLEGTKQVVGAALADKQFAFELYEADDKFEAKGEALQIVKNAADGSITFEGIKFTQAGTYRFVVIEKNDSQENYTYDNSVWHVTIEVKDNGEGDLIAEKTIIKKGDKEPSETFMFENIYVADEAPNTGDTFNISLWLGLLFINIIVLFGIVFYMKKKEESK